MKTKKISSKFIENWEKKYDDLDEEEYHLILNLVKNDIINDGGISFITFEKLYKWKIRGRSFHNIDKANYANIYNENIKLAISLPETKKIYILNGMPGVGIAVASTILHFIFPNQFPIIDINTIKTLKEFGFYDTNIKIQKLRDSPEAYNDFRYNILEIQKNLNGDWALHQIDKALFTYGKNKDLKLDKF